MNLILLLSAVGVAVLVVIFLLARSATPEIAADKALRAALRREDADAVVAALQADPRPSIGLSRQAIQTLTQIGDPRAEALMAALPKESAGADAGALDSDALVERLQATPRPSANVCHQALRALAERSDPRVAAIALSFLEGPRLDASSMSMPVAVTAIEVLSDLDDPRLRLRLLALLNDGNNNEQLLAANSLASVGRLEDVAALMAVRDEALEVPWVRKAAEKSIAALQANARAEPGALSISETDNSGSLSLATSAGEGALSVASDILKP